MFALINGTPVALIPKAGTQSIQEFAQEVITNTETNRYKHAIAFLRNPLTRLVSCYSFLHNLIVVNKQNTSVNIAAENLSSYSAFIDYMLLNDDEHWIPQVELIQHDRETHQTVFYTFENMPETFKKLFSINLQHINSSQHLEISSYRLDDITRYYKGDFEKWLSL